MATTESAATPVTITYTGVDNIERVLQCLRYAAESRQMARVWQRLEPIDDAERAKFRKCYRRTIGWARQWTARAANHAAGKPVVYRRRKAKAVLSTGQ
jgi:hypothetical protein